MIDVIGSLFKGHDGKFYIIESQDRCGYNIRDIADPNNYRNISERAPYRTFWPARELPSTTAAVKGARQGLPTCRLDRISDHMWLWKDMLIIISQDYNAWDFFYGGVKIDTAPTKEELAKTYNFELGV